jgi:hypothetical protein
LKPSISRLCTISWLSAQASLQEIADDLNHRCGVRMCTATIRVHYDGNVSYGSSRFDGCSRQRLKGPSATAIQRPIGAKTFLRTA